MRHRDESISFLDLSFEDKLQRLHYKILFDKELDKNEKELLSNIVAVIIDVEGGYQNSVNLGGGILITKGDKEQNGK